MHQTSAIRQYVGEHFLCSPAVLSKDGYALTGSVELPFYYTPPITVSLYKSKRLFIACKQQSKAMYIPKKGKRRNPNHGTKSSPEDGEDANTTLRFLKQRCIPCYLIGRIRISAWKRQQASRREGCGRTLVFAVLLHLAIRCAVSV